MAYAARARWAFIALVAQGAFAGLFVSAAGAADIGCGSEVTVNTTLRHDLTCSGDGFLVDNGVTLNLGGHTIQGSGQGAGITVDGPGFGTVVTNGTIRRFGIGILPDGATVSHLRINGNSSAGVSYIGNCISLSDSVVTENAGPGITIDGIPGCAVLTTTVGGNAGDGIDVFGQSDGTVLRGDTVVNNRGDGISVQDSVTSFVNDTTSRNGGDGIDVSETFPPPIATGYFFAGNLAEQNQNYGMEVFLEFPDQQVSDGGGNIARHNGNPAQCFNVPCITSDLANPTPFVGPAAPLSEHHKP